MTDKNQDETPGKRPDEKTSNTVVLTEWLAQPLRLFWSYYLRLFHRATIRGFENLPRTGPVVVVANHQSFYDGQLVGARAGRPMIYFVTKAYFEIPIMGTLLRRLGCIPLAPSGGGDSYRAGLDALRQGKALMVFPEGRRSLDGDLLKLRSGAARMALLAGAPVMPASIVGAFEAWPRHRWLPRWGRPILVKYHPPIRCEVATKEEIRDRAGEVTAEIEAIFNRRLDAWQRLRRRRYGRSKRSQANRR